MSQLRWCSKMSQLRCGLVIYKQDMKACFLLTHGTWIFTPGSPGAPGALQEDRGGSIHLGSWASGAWGCRLDIARFCAEARSIPSRCLLFEYQNSGRSRPGGQCWAAEVPWPVARDMQRFLGIPETPRNQTYPAIRLFTPLGGRPHRRFFLVRDRG